MPGRSQYGNLRALVLLVGLSGCQSAASTTLGSPYQLASGSIPAWRQPPPASSFFASKRELWDWYRSADPLASYGVHEQLPPSGFVRLVERLSSGDFPGAEVAFIKGFEVGGDDSARYDSGDCSMLGNSGVLAPDGTLCPNVLYGGKLLTPEQTQRLLKIAKAPPPDLGQGRGRPTYRCGDTIDTTFIFYSKAGVPIGLVNIDSYCSTWQLVPAPSQSFEGLKGQSDEEHEVLRSVCTELGLTSCVRDENANARAEYYRAHRREIQRALFDLVLSEAPPVRNLLLKELTHIERIRVCTWSRRALAAAARLRDGLGVPSPGSTLTVEATGRTLEFVGIDSCAKEQLSDCRVIVDAAANEARRVYRALAAGGIEFPAACTPGMLSDPPPLVGAAAASNGAQATR